MLNIVYISYVNMLSKIGRARYLTSDIVTAVILFMLGIFFIFLILYKFAPFGGFVSRARYKNKKKIQSFIDGVEEEDDSLNSIIHNYRFILSHYFVTKNT